MKYALKKSKEGMFITLNGSFEEQKIGELKKKLLQKIQNNTTLRIDISGLEDTTYHIYQLLLSCAKTVETGKPVVHISESHAKDLAYLQPAWDSFFETKVTENGNE